jgi:hypothetical protein
LRGLVKFLKEKGVKAERCHYGYEFPELCLSTFNSELRSQNDPVGCLGVGLPEEGELAA